MTELPTRAELELALVPVNKKTHLGLLITHTAVVLLLLLLSGLHFFVPGNDIALWLFKIVPLLIFIPGFIKKYYRSYSWLCFVILAYFIWITPLALYRKEWSDFAILALTAIIFMTAMMSSRWLQQQSYLQWQITQSPLEPLPETSPLIPSSTPMSNHA
jgi:uncharacterized membrane protein